MENKRTKKNLVLSNLKRISSIGVLESGYRIHTNQKAEKIYKNKLLDRKTNLSKSSKKEFSYSPLISIIMPTFQTPLTFLKETIQSILSQSYSNWELCIADGSEGNTELRALLKEYSQQDSRIKVSFLPKNLGISENTNQAIKLCQGEYLALMDHDDLLHADALYLFINELNNDPSIDVCYTDEDKITVDASNHFCPHFKPGYNKELLLCTNYISHFFLFRHFLLEKAGGFSSDFDGSQDHDFILRITDCARNVIHLPFVLYHWRVHNQSTAGNGDNKSYTFLAAQNALTTHLDTYVTGAHISTTKNPGYYLPQFPMSKNDSVHLIIHTQGNCDAQKKMIEASTSFPNYTIHFFSTIKELNDFIKKEYDYTIILSNIKAIPSKDWLTQLISNAARPDIGIVSCGTTFHNNRNQYGFSYNTSSLIPLGNGRSIHDPGYFMEFRTARNVAIASFECIAFENQKIPQNFYFQPNLHPQFSTMELCFLLEQSGMHTIVLPTIQMESRGSLSKKEWRIPSELLTKWKKRISKEDTLISHIL